MDNEQKITNDIKVPDKNIEVLKNHFAQCFDKSGKFDLERFKLEISSSEVDFSKESYTLDWLGKSYARLLASDAATTLLKEDAVFNQREANKNSQNLLIKGDNLEVLKHLSNAYYEKIKMVYIDPPYNTGSDGFVYQDNRKFTVRELCQLAGLDEEKAKRILDFTGSKSNSHSAWLTFMYPRLYVAKHLLRDDGVIFISIDDNEVAQLRLVMNEIFGEENFIANIVWQKKYTRANDARWFSDNHDHLLCYGKNKTHITLNMLPRNEEQLAAYSNPDNHFKGNWKATPLHAKSGTNTSSFTFKNGKQWAPPNGTFRRFTDASMKKMDEENEIWFGQDGSQIPSRKSFLCDVKDGVNPVTLWTYNEVGHNHEANNELKALGLGGLFDNPKPTRLLKRTITLVCNKTELILDFFAGSGTTGDAVMQLNAEDGGSRKYILVQLPELIDPKKDKTAYDFVKDELGVVEPTIFEITKERLIRAAKKIKGESIASGIAEKESEIKALNDRLDLGNRAEAIQELIKEIEKLKQQDLGFKIFETMPIWEDYDLEADELNSQTVLFDESQLTEEDLKALLVTWKTYDGAPLTQDLQAIDLGGYIGYFVIGKLYLVHKGFTTENLKALLEKIDSDQRFNPTSIIAFGYHFDSKNLRELAENVKSYTNKKNIDIDFITRY